MKHHRTSTAARRVAVGLVTASTFGAIAALIPAPLQAQASTGEVRGQVGTDTAVNFDGAEVTIVELGRRTITRNGGRFVFDGVPAGEYTLRVVYLGAEPVSQWVTVVAGQSAPLVDIVLRNAGGLDASVNAILVVGQSASASSAANRKRNSPRISDSVSADFIGQFPDQNVTEAAQRIPGVAINRDQGEGRFISVRGADPNLNAVTINGVDVPAAGGVERAVALDVIPSDVLQTLTVVKSLTPDLDANSIGGTVQIGTASAFDRRDAFFRGEHRGQL